jgi:hypothetical protein
MGERTKSKVTKALGILNKYGQLWTHNTFETEDEARKHLSQFWASPGFTKADYDPKSFKVVPVRVTVTPLRARPSTDKEGGRGS